MREQTQPSIAPSRRNSARQRRAWWVGFLLSAAIHLVLLFGWRADDRSGPGSLAAGPRAGDFRAAAGGGPLIAIDVAAPKPIDVPPPPEVRPRVDLPDVPERDLQPEVLAVSFQGPTGGQATPGSGGPGLPGAEGAGDGGDDLEGRDRRTYPTPRSIIPRWDAPKELKGHRVTFRVKVDARGEPTGEVEMQPRIRDADFARRVREDLLAMDYLPGRLDGRPVAEWAELTFTF